MISVEQARDILRIRRPGRPVEADPELREALLLVEQDEGLRRWWVEHQRHDGAVRAALNAIPVPAGLAERIRERGARKTIAFPGVGRWLWAAAAAIVLAISVWMVWWQVTPHEGFTAYRNRMARAAVREYRMSLSTNDAGVIQRYLAREQAPAGYRLASAVQALPSLGCGVVRWQNRPVSMLCFDRGNQELLWLFVTEAGAVPGAPSTDRPVFAPVGRLSTASWSDGRYLYVLALVGERRQLERYL